MILPFLYALEDGENENDDTSVNVSGNSKFFEFAEVLKMIQDW